MDVGQVADKRLMNSYMLAVILGCVLSGGGAAAQQTGDAFGSRESALQFTRQFGPAWRGKSVPMRDGFDGKAQHWRYIFSRTQFIGMTVQPGGQITRLYLYVGRESRADDGRSCVAFPDFARSARLLLDTAEPIHSKRQLLFLESMARLAWSPGELLKSTRIGMTNFRFSAFKGGCQIEVLRDILPKI